MPQTGFLLAEDEAVKAKFSGVSLIDTRNPSGNPVQVFYGLPNNSRETRFPYITIDLVSIDHARELQSSDQPINVTYIPDAATDARAAQATPPPSNVNLVSYEYIPVWLTYQVATWSRNAQHDRQLHAILLATNRISMRWGYLNIPADGTTRRFELLGWNQADSMERTDSETKRVWRKVYNLRCNAELTPFAIQTVAEVATVTVTLAGYVGDVTGGQGPYT